ncbi:MAG: hypothetical protein KC729_12870, partial [Candidatus Eisenbacteria bacterium]|nr:hypothetical protein [Candidatus Eisenbacteria bacterium]
MNIGFQAGRVGWLWLGALSGLMLGLQVSESAAQDRSSSRKTLKQIGVMEQILDQVLIDSPNFLVPGRGNARGIFLEQFGVLLTFEASLVQKDWGDWDWKNEFKIEKDEDGNRVIVIPDPGDKSDEDEDEDSGSRRDRDRRRRPSEERLYEGGKQEVEDVLLDYGGTLTALDDDNWVAVAAFLKDSDYFLDQRISRLVMKAKMRDLREWDAGKISEDEMRK